VRNGDLVQFNEVLERYGGQFQAERTYSLIVRLRHNVIKTGIRMISLSYSRYDKLKDEGGREGGWRGRERGREGERERGKVR
jgi:hypothetical protein